MKFLRHVGEMVRLKRLPRRQRRLIFYSEGRNYWTHLEGLVRTLLADGSTQLCYISSDPDDPGLALEDPRCHRFLTDLGWVRNWMFESVDADVVVMTMPDLNQYQVRRSRHQVHYVYVQHSLVSLHMAYRPGAFDHFDSLFCAGPHHVGEARALEAAARTPRKRLHEIGYSRLDQLLADAAHRPSGQASGAPSHILIAPSWGPNALIETVGSAVVTPLLDAGYRVTLRPHPQTLRLSPGSVAAIVDRYRRHPLFATETEVGRRDALLQADLMISDWSGAALEFALSRRRPVIFVDVPPKANNPDYAALGILPLEASLRHSLGAIVSPGDLDDLPAVVATLLAWGDLDSGLAARHVFNIGEADRAGAAAVRDILAEAERGHAQ